MNLGKQIDSLLKRYSAVYISGLGVFEKVHTSATFDSKRNVFLPPISIIEFDHFGTKGYDYLIYLQQLEQLDRNEAELRLRTVVTEILERVQQDGEFVLEHLGALVSYGNSFVFKPFDLSGFLHTAIKDDYMPTVVASEVHTEDAGNEEDLPSVGAESIELNPQAEESSSAILEDDTQDIEANDDAIVDDENNQVEEQIIKEKASGSYIYGLVAVIAIIALGGIYYYATLKPERSLVENNVIIESFPVDSNLNVLDTATVVPLDSMDQTISVQDTIQKEVVSQPIEKVVVDEKYAIVIGTHKLLELALEEAKSYNKKGHHSVRVLQPNMSKNLKRVVWDTYPTREKRDSALRVVRKLYKEDAWGTEL